MTTTSEATSVVDGFVEQCIRYDYAAPVRNLRQRLIVVPPLQHGRQHRVDWNIEVRGAEPGSVTTGRDTFGNVLIDVTVPMVESSVEFDVRTVVAFRDESGSPGRRPDPRYLQVTPLTAADDAIAQLVASRSGRGTTDVEPVCRQVHDALIYEFGVTGVRTTAAEALRGGRGVCQDYAHLMLAACRLVGIPARYVSGHLLGEGGSHAWVEVLRRLPGEPSAWTAEAWDPTHCRRTDERYITIATGRDYSDVAPTSGTFEGPVPGTLTVRKLARSERR